MSLASCDYDFDIVVVKSFVEALRLRSFFKKEFGVKTNFKKKYYKISFDYHDIEETTHFWDKNTYGVAINQYTVSRFIHLFRSSDNPSLLRKLKQLERQAQIDIRKCK